MPSDKALRLGTMLFERVLKVGNAGSWERMLLERPHLERDNIKGSVIGATFALLSQDRAHRVIADGYHGTIISVWKIHANDGIH